MSSHAEVVASLVSEYSGHEKKIAELQESVERLMLEVFAQKPHLVAGFRPPGIDVRGAPGL